MPAALSLSEVADLCRDSLAVADRVERAGGPNDVDRLRWDRARGVLESTLAGIEGGDIGFVPLVALGWVLAAAGVIATVAAVPTIIRGTRRVADTVASETSNVVEATGRVVRWAGYSALALASFFATRLILKKTA